MTTKPKQSKDPMFKLLYALQQYAKNKKKSNEKK